MFPNRIFGVPIIFAVTMLTSVAAHGQTRGALYGLGVNMGFAEAQASFALKERSYSDRMQATRGLALAALKTASSQVDAINLKLNPPLDASSLKSLYANQSTKVLRHTEGGPLGPTVGSSEEEFVNVLNPALYNTIVAVRSAMTATLTKATRGGPMFVHAFILGFNIAVAEAQATAGPDARQVVLLALTNARNDAKSLQLDLAPLDECIELSKGSAPLPDLHTKITAVRVTFQTLLDS